MNKSTDKIQKAQELLYDWISHFAIDESYMGDLLAIGF